MPSQNWAQRFTNTLLAGATATAASCGKVEEGPIKLPKARKELAESPDPVASSVREESDALKTEREKQFRRDLQLIHDGVRVELAENLFRQTAVQGFIVRVLSQSNLGISGNPLATTDQPDCVSLTEDRPGEIVITLRNYDKPVVVLPASNDHPESVFIVGKETNFKIDGEGFRVTFKLETTTAADVVVTMFNQVPIYLGAPHPLPSVLASQSAGQNEGGAGSNRSAATNMPQLHSLTAEQMEVEPRNDAVSLALNEHGVALQMSEKMMLEEDAQLLARNILDGAFGQLVGEQQTIQDDPRIVLNSSTDEARLILVFVKDPQTEFFNTPEHTYKLGTLYTVRGKSSGVEYDVMLSEAINLP